MTATIHTFPRRPSVGRAVLLGHPQVIDLRRVYEADLAIALEEPQLGWWAKVTRKCLGEK